MLVVRLPLRNGIDGEYEMLDSVGEICFLQHYLSPDVVAADAVFFVGGLGVDKLKLCFLGEVSQ